DLSPNQRPQDSEVVPICRAVFDCAEGSVCVLAINGFPVSGGIRVQGALGCRIILEVIFFPSDLAYARRGVLPIHFICRDVVRAQLARSRRRCSLCLALMAQCTRKQPESYRQSCKE